MLMEHSTEPDTLGPLKALTGPYSGMTEPVRHRRMRRLKALPGKSATYFHLMSRLCQGVPFFDDTEKEALLLVLRRLARFCGLDLLTFCIMGNHFHALVRVPDRQKWLKQFGGPSGEARLLSHLRTLYSKAFVELLQAQLTRWRQDGREDLAEACLSGIKARFCDISVFGKELKARFARWYNKRHNRRGALWMGRFHSVLVEGGSPADKTDSRDALKVMAAYIDLNPVRAGLVEFAEAYRWCGWSAALTGNKEAIEGLCEVVGCDTKQWDLGGRHAYAHWVSEHHKNNTGHTEASAGLLSSWRAFSRGVAIGREAFIEGVFGEYRDYFGERRKCGARQLHGRDAPWRKELRTLRELR